MVCRHLKRYGLATDCVGHWLFKRGRCAYEKDNSDLPNDAKLVNTYLAPDKNCIYFVFEHESFDEVLEGNIIPEGNSTGLRILSDQEEQQKGIKFREFF